ncbi:MAG TPA: molybdate ABC transporter substrate-binding protein [Syntrophorhabdaceae bacterium]|jgi:molybdate transport system substrate-binding protein|nr:molybdate ABC transporter substrate-binding protein [Syntrophorhabdaceae bacterium]MDI9561799.1 molybdate ABC transporter substrate-binding protein [Pseudomonadota bacterium]OQC48989.1 MAG: Molybdate-binding periplasmic protein precursor [Deltaproteobacteria bacterium ADurb.Bin026]HOD78497.1 molybdate ABC transporter substrate-binding protein [Syntrophorhabdus sp.]MBP8697975.1 molybdate ABC transporter substrate-binding protein [Syntrophorhabdaceae bacterium]
MRTFIALVIVCLALTQLCGNVSAGQITIGAGVGMKDVVNDIAAAFIKNNQSIKILKNYAASGVLAKQIDNGAHIDITLVANVNWMDYLKEKRYVDVNTITPFAYNTLVFVSKGAQGVSRLEELTKLNRIAVGSPKSVPAGEYTMEAFRNAGIYKQLEQKLVLARDVRECLLYAERGDVDGAIVYKTDALLSKDTTILFTVPQKLYSRVIFLSALTVSGVKNQDAVNFFSFLHSHEAKALLLKYGFEVQ